MSRQKRKNVRQGAARPMAGTVKSPVASVELAGTPVKDLMFRPLVYKKGHMDTIDFEHIRVPFLIKDGLVFFMLSMNSCGDKSNYIECHKMEPDSPCENYEDAMHLMKACLEAERMTQTPYYFGKLDSALEQYLYMLQIFVDKGIMEKEKALEMAGELGVPEEEMEQACYKAKADIEEAVMRRAAIGMEKKTAGEIMGTFIQMLTGKGE